MKKLGYYVFAIFYYLFRVCSIKKNKVFYIMTHDSSKGSNVGVVLERLKIAKRYEFYGIRKEDKKAGLSGMISFFILKPYHLATSSIVLQDNVFMPMAYLKFHKDVKIIQLWHGTGTIKKFGQSVNTGSLAQLEKRANSTITHLIVNSQLSKNESKEAFGVLEDKIYTFGLPRTDILFDLEKREEQLSQFYESYPKLKGKRIILYAPTFRDKEVNAPKLQLDINRLLDDLTEDYCIALRLHPFVAKAFYIEDISQYADRVINVSDYPDINGLMLASYLLITDYSSLIFEYCLLEKPMIFYPYDLDEFSNQGRGFYHDYKEYVPGPIVTDTVGLGVLIKKDQYDTKLINKFKNENYQYLDGKSTQRLWEEMNDK
jgi:CDP-glycerol glycerophosphotransferase (TagB/SpsB family)